MLQREVGGRFSQKDHTKMLIFFTRPRVHIMPASQKLSFAQPGSPDLGRIFEQQYILVETDNNGIVSVVPVTTPVVDGHVSIRPGL